MKKTVALGIMLFLVLSLCSSLQSVGVVSANFLPPQVPTHSIEIAEDGAVNGTDRIQRSGNVYTFTGDIEGSIVVLRSGIVIDGAGYTLQGNGILTGVWLQGKNDVTVKNMQIRNFSVGIALTYGFATGTSNGGCVDITVSGNTITDNTYGIRIWIFSSNNSVLGNTIENNTYGVYISYSPNNVLRNNQMRQNRYNLWVTSDLSSSMLEFVNDVDASNTVDGKPVVYWVNEHDKTVPSDAGYVALVNCTGITVQNLVLENNSQGVLLVATNNSLITGNQITKNDYGIVLFAPYEQCVGNNVTENTVTESNKDGINSWGSEGTIVTGNTITDNQEVGINFFASRDAVISKNTLSRNKEANIKIWGNDSSNNTVADNNEDSQADIPEFPSLIVLPLLITVTLAAIIYRKKLHKNGSYSRSY